MVNNFLFLAIQYKTPYVACKYSSFTVINFSKEFFSLFKDCNFILKIFLYIKNFSKEFFSLFKDLKIILASSTLALRWNRNN